MILHILREPNSIIVLLFIGNIVKVLLENKSSKFEQGKTKFVRFSEGFE